MTRGKSGDKTSQSARTHPEPDDEREITESEVNTTVPLVITISSVMIGIFIMITGQIAEVNGYEAVYEWCFKWGNIQSFIISPIVGLLSAGVLRTSNFAHETVAGFLQEVEA